MFYKKQIIYLFVIMAMSIGPLSASAKTYKMSSGTGFYITNYHVITNEHVVQDCKMIYIRGDKGVARQIPQNQVTLIAKDEDKDLAILKTRHAARKVANLRANNGIKEGDPVLVVGYPKNHGISGKYHKAKGTIIRVIGPPGREQFVEFTDSVQQGNSGGPLLDPNGNIIGVITGIMSYYNSNTAYLSAQAKKEPLRRTGIAVSLTQLKKFLHQHNIFYRINNTFGKYPERNIESTGQHMIVNVHCIKNEN